MHTLALWVEPTKYRDFIPVLYEIERHCSQYRLDFYDEFHRFMNIVKLNKSLHHPNFNIDTLESDLLEFISHLHSRGDNIGNWKALHSLLYYTPNPIIFRRGGKQNMCDMDNCIDLSMKYCELYIHLIN